MWRLVTGQHAFLVLQRKKLRHCEVSKWVIYLCIAWNVLPTNDNLIYNINYKITTKMFSVSEGNRCGSLIEKWPTNQLEFRNPFPEFWHYVFKHITSAKFLLKFNFRKKDNSSNYARWAMLWGRVLLIQILTATCW